MIVCVDIETPGHVRWGAKLMVNKQRLLLVKATTDYYPKR